ncbi:MAG: hypothetical protein Q4P28_04250 [Tissierellia bacterium]|nr:hypothetical protein [Tissierellia bacterium]
MKMNITRDAKKQLEILKNNHQYLRLKILQFSCCSFRFTVIPDQRHEDDLEFVMEGIPFVIEKELYDLFDRFTVEYFEGGIRDGFQVMAYKRRKMR